MQLITHLFYMFSLHLVGYISSSTGFLFPRISDFSYRATASVEILILKQTASYRHRRSNDCTPDKLGVRFTADQTVVELLLRKSYEIDVNVPVFVNRNGAIVEEFLNKTENVAVYQDAESGSVMLVQCLPEKRKLELFGTFYNGSEELMIEPEITEGEEEFLAVNTSNDPDLVSESKGEEVLEDARLGKEFSISHHAIVKGEAFTPGITDFIEIEESHPKYQQGSGYSLRVKRDGTTYQAELLMVADYSTYQFWLTKASSSTKAKERMRQFYAFVLTGIDLRYKSVTGSGSMIIVVFAGLYIAETSSGSPWTEDIKVLNGSVYQINSTRALTDFRTWVNSRTDLPDHDHAMLFTKYDLQYNGSNNTIGLAYVRATCTTSSQSIIEDDFNARMVTVAAHELGHSLGAQHDGTIDGTGDSCSPTLAYIMAAAVTLYGLGTTEFKYNTNLWKFSSCSVSYFQQYISTLNSTNCLTILSPRYNASALFPYDQDPGQIYSVDTQCQYSLGSDSFFCRVFYDGNYTDICSLIYCAIPGTSSCVPRIPAEKTSCGNGKWCVAGKCVASAEAPSVNDSCPFGDQPGIVVNGLICAELIANSSAYCYYYLKECCKSCQNVYIGITGCEYGDKSTWCVGRGLSDCYLNENLCCGLCLPNKRNITGCEYGDKTNCSTVSRRGCYVNEAVCCGTCLPQKGTITGCEYGDKANCSAVSRYGCYANEAVCCGTCLPQKGTITGCEFGDKATGCNLNSCGLNNSTILALCCETCYISPSTTTTIAAPITTTITMTTKPKTTTPTMTTTIIMLPQTSAGLTTTATQSTTTTKSNATTTTTTAPSPSTTSTPAHTFTTASASTNTTMSIMTTILAPTISTAGPTSSLVPNTTTMEAPTATKILNTATTQAPTTTNAKLTTKSVQITTTTTTITSASTTIIMLPLTPTTLGLTATTSQITTTPQASTTATTASSLVPNTATTEAKILTTTTTISTSAVPTTRTSSSLSAVSSGQITSAVSNKTNATLSAATSFPATTTKMVTATLKSAAATTGTTLILNLMNFMILVLL